MKARLNKYLQNCTARPEVIDPGLREKLILEYAHLVKNIAERMAIRLPPHISKDELVSAGIVGLIDAVEKFDSEMGTKFRTYAEHRIRGAMLDELRRMDWIPRSVRRDVHRIERAIKELQVRLGRSPDDFEIAQEMGIDIDAYYELLSRARGVGLLNLDEIGPGAPPSIFERKASDTPSPFDELKKRELKRVISKALSSLSKKEEMVLSLYYYEELTLKEIAKIMGLTESRISQIHSKAIVRLRAKLKSYYQG